MLNKEKVLSWMVVLSFILLFGTFFIRYLSINLWDNDFWWHIATGKYIVTDRHLPEKDIFSYTSGLEENKNPFPVLENFSLKQYWLSQIIFYLIYDYAGPKGIVLLRSCLLVATLLVVFWRLRRWSVSFPISFVFVFGLFMVLFRSTGERPVLFTILFTAVVFFVLEDFKDKRDKRIFLLVPLMLLWANLHGGFVIGIVIILAFMLAEGIRLIFKKSSYTGYETIFFYAATTLAVGFSFINPTGWDAVVIALSSKYKLIFEGIQEYQPPFLLYRNKIYPVDYAYLSLIVISAAVLVLRNKRIDFAHIILLLGTFIMSLSASRFIVYFAVIASMVTGKEADMLARGLLEKRFSERAHQRVFAGLAAAILFSSILFTAGLFRSKNFSFNTAYGSSVPKAAVDFIENNKLSGNMFNSYAYGGFIAWRLYPRQKTFINSRLVNPVVKTEFNLIVRATEYAEKAGPSASNIPLWEKMVNHYKINFIFVSLAGIYGEVPPLIIKLAESDKWIPVYCDSISIIFVRNTKENTEIIEEFELKKEDVYNAIVTNSVRFALYSQYNPRPLISLGDIFYKMGRLSDSLRAYQYALKRMPENTAILEKINKVESEMKGNR